MLEPTLTPDLEEGIAELSLEDVDVDSVPERKPHFLDYDAVPPPDYEEGFGASSGEQLKMDKKYERDGEVSDYELPPVAIPRRSSPRTTTRCTSPRAQSDWDPEPLVKNQQPSIFWTRTPFRRTTCWPRSCGR